MPLALPSREAKGLLLLLLSPLPPMLTLLLPVPRGWRAWLGAPGGGVGETLGETLWLPREGSAAFMLSRPLTWAAALCALGVDSALAAPVLEVEEPGLLVTLEADERIQFKTRPRPLEAAAPVPLYEGTDRLASSRRDTRSGVAEATATATGKS